MADGGDMGARIRAYDWASSPLGAPEHWPQSLKTCVRVLLTSRQPMFVWWGENLVNIYNDAYKSIVGGKHPWALGQPASEVWAEIWDQVGPRAESSMKENKGTYDEALLLIMERNGYREETYYTFSYSPVPTDEGGTGGIFCANTEDTPRIVGERQLAVLSALGQAAAEARTWREACERGAAALGGNPRDLPFCLIYAQGSEGMELAGASGIAADHPAAAPATWPLDRALDSGQAVLWTCPPGLPSGPWPEAPAQVALLRIPSSSQPGVLVVGLNPFRLWDTAYAESLQLIVGQLAAGLGRARAYEEERQRAESLAELDRAKTAFFSNVSHELRTPLTLILGPLEELLGQGLSVQLAQELQVVYRNSKRLLKLVNTLLDFSRIEAGRVRAVFQPTDLAQLTAGLASVFRSACEKAGLELLLDCPPLPQPVYVDHDMWEKIVLNLVSNAFKYTLAGSILVKLTPLPEGVRLSVRDTGTGIPAQAQARLFERFYRVEGARGRSVEGSGIGLALVAELARLHGGRVHVESAVGCGSTFHVDLPWRHEHLPADTSGPLGSTATVADAYVEEALRWLPDAGKSATARRMPRAGRVLLADDNADMRDYVARLLEEEWEVETVGSGLEALEAARRRAPDVLVSDVMMPGLDGFGVLRELRRDPVLAAIPVILLSARAGEEARLDGLQAGADDYLTKPFSARELQVRVASVVSLARVRHEARAREAQLKAQWVDVLESISQAFIALDQDFRFVYVNGAAERVCGMQREQMLGRNHWDVFPESVGTKADREYHAAMNERTPRRFETFYKPWEVWFEIDVYPSSNGGLAIYFRDITQHKRDTAVLSGQREALEKALHDAPMHEVLEALTRAVEAQAADQVLASVLLLDNDGQHLRYGAGASLPPALLEAIGNGAGDAGGGSGESLASPRHLQPCVVEDIVTHPDWASLREVASRHNLRSCWSTPIISSQGKVLGTFALHARRPRAPRPEDIQTVELVSRSAALILERFSAEASARENRERLVASLQASRTGTYRWDLQRDELVWDEALKRLFGAVDAEVHCLDHFLQFVAPEDRERVRVAYQSCRSGGGELDIEFRILHSNGTVWLYDRGQARDGWMTGACVDITQRKNAEAEREQLLESERAARSDAERTSRLKDEFLATLSHELRTPLNAILGWSQMLRRQTEDPDCLQGLEVIERNSRLQTQLIEDLLDMSRIISGKMRLDVQQVDVHAVIQAAIDSVRPGAEAKGIRLQTVLDPRAGPVLGDPGRLQQCLWNLLSNAVKFTPRDGRIQVALQRVNSHIEISVTDSGSGIKPEFLPHLFDRFRQADSSTTRHHGGLGLGLSIVRHLVELHGGRVQAASLGNGKGATFTLELPLVGVHPLPGPEEPAHPASSPGSGPVFNLPDLSHASVVVVDDEQDSRDLVRRVLEECGARVWTAGCARDGLKLLQEHLPAMLISDIGMPGEDGYEFIRKVRALPADAGGLTPAAALTAFARAEDRTRALLAGYHAHLVKPVEPMELAATVVRLARPAP
jgi:PAS domain S-box-containing protein